MGLAGPACRAWTAQDPEGHLGSQGTAACVLVSPVFARVKAGVGAQGHLVSHPTSPEWMVLLGSPGPCQPTAALRAPAWTSRRRMWGGCTAPCCSPAWCGFPVSPGPFCCPKLCWVEGSVLPVGTQEAPRPHPATGPRHCPRWVPSPPLKTQGPGNAEEGAGEAGTRKFPRDSSSLLIAPHGVHHTRPRTDPSGEHTSCPCSSSLLRPRHPQAASGPLAPGTLAQACAPEVGAWLALVSVLARHSEPPAVRPGRAETPSASSASMVMLLGVAGSNWPEDSRRAGGLEPGQGPHGKGAGP